VMALVVSLFAAALFIQVDYKITATGTLEPAVVQNLFATTDGVVTRLHVQDGEFVEKGDLLIELENAELQRQSEEIAGEIYTATEKLAAINAAMTSVRIARSEASLGESNAIERRQLETQLKSLKAQQAVVLAEKERLAIRSPIAGQVIGWRLSQRLEQRPVSRGHRLFSVVDVNGPKVLKLQVPDRDSADVLQYAESTDGPLAVNFILAAEPDQSRAATVVEIASATRVDDQGLNVLDVMANIPDQTLDTSKMGTDVTAAIHCGRRSIMATWFGDVARFYHRHVRFYFG
jgi:multidrug efflux pump subunit AcrA (membrane-fusion protein)